MTSSTPTAVLLPPPSQYPPSYHIATRATPLHRPQQRRRHSSLDSFVGHFRSSISSNIPMMSTTAGGSRNTNGRIIVRGGGTLANYHRPRRRRLSTSSTASSVTQHHQQQQQVPFVVEGRLIERRQSSSAVSITPQQIQRRRRNSSIGVEIYSGQHRHGFYPTQHTNTTITTPVDVIVHYPDQPRRNSSIASTNQFHQHHQPRLSNARTMQQLQQHRFRSNNRNHQPHGTTDAGEHHSCGPNLVLKVMARESTGKSIYPRSTAIASSPTYNELLKLKYVTGKGFITKYINTPSRGMVTEIELLSNAIDIGDWNETYRCINRLETRLMSNNNYEAHSTSTTSANPPPPVDPTLPRNAHRYYAGGGRNGYDRDIFTLYGGVQVLLRIFYEKAFVGQEMSESYDARDLTTNIVTTRLAPCWIDVLTLLRELIIYVPSLMDGTALVDDDNFLPFLFTLLVHDALFDPAATLIEEMLSIMSQTQQTPNHDDTTASLSASQHTADTLLLPPIRPKPTMTFFLGNVSDLYKLWRGFNCRQLAHFCRILAFLIFEPEDRQLLESPAVLKSIELLQLRRNRTVRSGYDCTVDLNQSIVLGDEVIIRRLLTLLRTMNYAPSLARLAHCNGMSLFPLVADTLFMVGLNELESWPEVDRQDALARTLIPDDNENDPNHVVRLCDLGAVSDMLEMFMNTISQNERRIPPTHVSHIIQVLSAAQQAGVIVGRNRPARRLRNRTNNDGNLRRNNSETEVNNNESSDFPVDDATVQGLESAAGILSEQVFIRRFFSSDHGGSVAGESSGDEVNANSNSGHRHMINTPEDAANSLQFNAMLLNPYQVEVLFVLCTLLGGRRKLDAQDMMNRLGIVPVMDDMIQRLPWSDIKSSSSSHNGTIDPTPDHSSHIGTHGPGCECTPENALCIQYLRLFHNFCDRDCENYDGRQLLLSDDEREYVTTLKRANDIRTTVQLSQELPPMKYGLLRKVVDAFIGESDESSYRFWLASCIEAFLRGSSMAEQMFVAQAGLMDHLTNEICCNRLHCAGSLQTSFDLLGEVGKGNDAVLELMLNSLDESCLHKLLSIASKHLVDSNVFLRSMLIGVERISAMRNGTAVLYMDMTSSNLDVVSFNDEYSLYQRSITGSYLSYSWWDTPATPMWPTSASNENDCDKKPSVLGIPADRTPTDWFPPLDFLQYCHRNVDIASCNLAQGRQNGWIFAPPKIEAEERHTLANPSSSIHSWKIHVPNTIERLHWFIHMNQAQLLHDLLSVVNLRNINHENICCLNTAVVVTIFAYRRNELHQLIQTLRVMNMPASDKHSHNIWGQRLCYDDTKTATELVDRMQSLELSESPTGSKYNHGNTINTDTITTTTNTGHDILYNFRQVLWFWVEYYTHRGRDRLSLEYSSHLRYDDWISVVTILTTYLDHELFRENTNNGTDDIVSSPSSLLFITTDHAALTATKPLKNNSNNNETLTSPSNHPRSLLPRSPYQRAAHVVVGTDFVSLRGE